MTTPERVNLAQAPSGVPRVSVLMAFLDAAPYIREAIESVIAQTYPAWELLLIDDGSRDGSTEIAREYAKRLPDKVRYLEHPNHENRGKSAALNAGLRGARGEFLALLDADDVWLPNKLAEQVPLLDAHPDAGMLYGHTLFWRSWRGDADTVPPLGPPLNAVSAPPDILLLCLQRRAVVPCTCSVLMRRAVVEQVGGFEEAFTRVFTDQAFYAKILLATPVYVADRLWDKYRIHDASAVAVAKRSGTLVRERIRYLDFLAAYLKRRGLASGPVWRVVRDERRRLRHPALHRTVASITTRIRAAIPDDVRTRLRRVRRPPGGVRFGNLRRVVPVSREFGLDRGQPVDRHYIEHFLAQHARDVAGHALEVGDDTYIRSFGGDRVTVTDVLHVREGSPKATIVADLTDARTIASDTFDCIILTQTLHLVFDIRAAVATLHRILKPGGVLLATVPGISQIDAGRWSATWYWSLTPVCVERLFAEQFPLDHLEVRSHGNVLAACAFLQGLAAEELSPAELAANDPLYPVVVTLRARKAVG